MLHILFYIYRPHLRIYLYVCIFVFSLLVFSRKKVKRRGISPHLCFFYYFQYVRFYSFLSVDFIVLSNFDCPFPSVALVLLGTWHLVLGTWHLALGTWHLALGTWHYKFYFLFLVSYFLFLISSCSSYALAS